MSLTLRQLEVFQLESPAITRKLALHLRPGETLHPAARQLADHLS